MKDHRVNQVPLAVLTVGLAMHVFVPGCQTDGRKPAASPEQRQRLEAMQAKGAQASLTIFPVVMGDGALEDVADVLALLLEQAGMKRLETTDRVFRLPKEATRDQAAALFGDFIHEHPIETEYTLYAEFVGTPQTGPSEIHGVIVNSAGQPVWIDRQTPADRDFKRIKPSCPMTCCYFLAERIRTLLDIPDSARDESGQGKFARMFAENSPAPGEAEWTAMKQRQAAMKERGRSAGMSVYPVRLSDTKGGKPEADHLASLLNATELCEAKAVNSPLRVKIEPARNEQKLLWDLARQLQGHLQQNPPETDYALLADYIMEPHSGRPWAVHFVLCDRDGQWVIVDFQNEHHGDFQSIDPKTSDDCGRLIARRLQGYLQ